MSSFWIQQTAETNISIPDITEEDGVTMYKIVVQVGEVTWFFHRRYRDFYEFHSRLVSDHLVEKDILPPKRFRNRSPAFIESRRQGLETYLRSIFIYLRMTMPRVLVQFLDFHLYDCFYLLQELALRFYEEGDALLAEKKHYEFDPLQLHAISECLQAPYPQTEESDKRYNLSHVFDFCSQLLSIKIIGSGNPYKNSNIIPDRLSFDLCAFKNLKKLHLIQGVPSKIQNVGNLRNCLEVLKVNCNVNNFSDILLCDVMHKTSITKDHVWHNITTLDLRMNAIQEIDSAVKLAPNTDSLLLSHNKLSDISNLTSLVKLTELGLSNNQFQGCDNLHTKLGNIRSIDLSSNSIVSLKGFEKLYSLESLDLSCNKIIDVDEIKYICNLPCLLGLWLTANPVASVVDYRVKVLQQFGSRCSEILLDSERASQKELDTVGILQALNSAKRGNKIMNTSNA